jgi:hypothetical protein
VIVLLRRRRHPRSGTAIVLPDRRVTFRLSASKANDVKVLIGVKSGIYESQGIATTEMTKDAKDFWTVTLGLG